MTVIADYTGTLLSHIQLHYRAGERDLAIELSEALGCAITDTGMEINPVGNLLAIHPNPDDRNFRNNVLYISQMPPEQEVLEGELLRSSAEDGRLGDSLAKYRSMARRRPFGAPHFAVRYESPEAVERVAERLDPLAKKLGDRVNLRLFRPGDPDAIGNDPLTGFLDQDILVSGAFLFSQLIELQTQRQV